MKTSNKTSNPRILHVVVMLLVMVIAAVADCYVELIEGTQFGDGTESAIYGCDTNNNVIPAHGVGDNAPLCIKTEVEPNDVPETCVDQQDTTGYDCVPGSEIEHNMTQHGTPTVCPVPDFLHAVGPDPFGCVDWRDSGPAGTPITIHIDALEDCYDEFYQH